MVSLHHGNPLMVDYTPTAAAVAGGDVVVAGNTPYPVHNPIEQNRLGAIAAFGGVYKGTSDGTIATPAVKVYWDAGASKFTTTAAGNTHFGFAMPDQGATNDGDQVFVEHRPQGG